MNFDISSLIETYGYIGFFLFGMFNFVIPSEPVMTLAGYQIHEGNLNYFWVLGSAMAGSFVKSSIIFGTGYILGEQFLIKYHKYTGFRPEYLDYIKSKIGHYGYRIITPLQLVPYIRRFVAAPCGLLRLNYPKFMLYNMLGVSIWFSLLMSLGYIFGKGFKAISPTFRFYSKGTGYVVLGIFVLVIGFEFYKHWKSSRPKASVEKDNS